LMYLLRRFRDRTTSRRIQEQRRFYEQARTPDAIRAWQLQWFNEQWQAIARHVPYYRRLVLSQDLPPRFSSWQQFSELLPIIERKTVQQQGGELIDVRCPPDTWRTTGGSTA